MRSALVLSAAVLALACAGCRSPRDPCDRGDLTVGVGAYDVGFLQGHNRRTAGALVEYRAPPRWWVLRPVAGVQVGAHGSAYGYGGAMADLALTRHLRVAPVFVVGGWVQGDAKDLDFPVQFRSGFEVGYEFESGVRMGIAAYHTSNAGLGEGNPGAESILFNVSVPVERLGIR